MGQVASQAPEPKLPVSGETLGGKYRIERVIGEGGMAVVYEATHLRIGQRVAIKMLLPQTLADPELVARFSREARAAGQLRSANTAQVFDVDATAEGVPFIVMELLHGHDLSVELERRGPMPVVEAVDCAIQVARAMAEAHANGVIHRDLKPSNLFLSWQGDTVTLKILDFGISKIATRGEVAVNVTSTLALMGTPLYMSPEQVRSSKNVDARTDVWSLGVILYELLTGQPPFNGTAMAVSAAIVADEAPRLRSFRADVPEGVEAVVARAMTKSPADRWQSMTAIADALAPFGSAAGAALFQPSSGKPLMMSRAIESATPRRGSAAQPAITRGAWSSRSGVSGLGRNRVALFLVVGGIAGLGGVVSFVVVRPREAQRFVPSTAATAASLPESPSTALAPATSVAAATSEQSPMTVLAADARAPVPAAPPSPKRPASAPGVRAPKVPAAAQAPATDNPIHL
jgi:serine/threonine-protein kinase